MAQSARPSSIPENLQITCFLIELLFVLNPIVKQASIVILKNPKMYLLILPLIHV